MLEFGYDSIMVRKIFSFCISDKPREKMLCMPPYFGQSCWLLMKAGISIPWKNYPWDLISSPNFKMSCYWYPQRAYSTKIFTLSSCIPNSSIKEIPLTYFHWEFVSNVLLSRLIFYIRLLRIQLLMQRIRKII